MTRRIDFVDAPEAAQADFGHYQTECSVFDVPGQTWGAWWARYGADYIDSDTWWLDDQPVGENAAEEPGHDRHPASGSSAVQIVPGCAHGPAATLRTPERPAFATTPVPDPRPQGQRSLRNRIAHAIYEEVDDRRTVRVLTDDPRRFCLELAQRSIDESLTWLQQFGARSLIDEVSR